MDYQLHKERITRLFCVNKDKPKLQCNGKCHLAKKLRKAAETESKAPASGFAKIKYEVILPFVFRVAAPSYGRPQPRSFAAALARRYADAPAHGIFHPPALKA